MNKYVIATTGHFSSAHNIGQLGHRLSLDGTQMVHEVAESDTAYDACPDCHVFSHPAALTFLGKVESKGIWWQDDIQSE